MNVINQLTENRKMYLIGGCTPQYKDRRTSNTTTLSFLSLVGGPRALAGICGNGKSAVRLVTHAEAERREIVLTWTLRKTGCAKLWCQSRVKGRQNYKVLCFKNVAVNFNDKLLKTI